MKRYIMILVLVCMMISLSACGNSNRTGKNDIMVNQNIILERGFSVNSNSTEMNTSAKGTVYVKGAEGVSEQVQIIAWIEIDPNDWSGVTFYIPNNWHITNITSSYPERKIQTKTADYVATWTNAETEYEWNTMVRVGRGHSYIPTGGGTGTVVIDLVLDKDITLQPDIFNNMVAVGSDEKDGIKIEGPDHISIEIPIT
ncbi:MAG: hypothetical protein ACOX8P_10645 [Tepidanaerobacteraceae bacterium]|jgi:hypothetical protein